MSKLLMGALVVLTVGVFSSCKDYDDEINANKASIKSLQSQVDALEQARAALRSELDAAKLAIENADRAIKQTQSDLTAAKTELQNAINTKASQEDLTKLENKVASLEAELKSIAQTYVTQEALAAELQTRDARLLALEQKTKDLDAEVKLRLTTEEFNKVLETLATKQGLEDALKPLADDIAKLQEDLKANGEADAALANKLDEELNKIYQNYVTNSKFETAVAQLSTEISAVRTDLTTLINEKDAEYNAKFATITALNQALDQIKTLDDARKSILSRLDGIDGKVEIIEQTLTTLATKQELETLEATLRTLISTKVDQSVYEAAMAAIDETIKTLATKAELSAEVEKINGELTNLRNMIANRPTREEMNEELLKLKTWVNQQGFQNEAQVKALIAATEATLVAKINTLETTLTGKITGLDTKIGNLDTKIDGVKSSLLAKIAECAKQSDLELTNEQVDGLKNTMTEISGTVNSLTAQFDAMASQLNALADDLEGMWSDFEEATPAEAKATAATGTTENAGVAAIKRIITAMANNIDQLYGFVNSTFAAVQEKLDVVTFFVTKSLTSIVTLPDEWLYGLPKIEAIQVKQPVSFKYNSPEESDILAMITPNGIADEDALEALIMQKGGAKRVTFDIIAKYWMNPSKFDPEMYNYSFDEIPTVNTITRTDHDYDKAGFKDLTWKIHEGKINAKGIQEVDTMFVTFNVENDENVNNALTVGRVAGEGRTTYAWITTLALKATMKDEVVAKEKTYETDKRVVTSDYAILAPSYIDTLIVANGSSYVTAANLHNPGNLKGHCNNTFAATWTEDLAGDYSFSLNRTDKEGKINLNDSLRIHYKENGSEEEKIWTIEDAKKKGFEVSYTILTDAAYFQGADTGIIKVNDTKRDEASTAGKAAIVLVQLTAGGVTQAYGYVSIIITNDTTIVPVEIPSLKLNCETMGTIAWEDVLDSIAKYAGFDDETVIENETYFEWMEAAAGTTNGGYQKYEFADESNVSSETQKEVEDNLYGEISKGQIATDEGALDVLMWQFSKEDVLEKFFNADGTIKEGSAPYSVWIKIKATTEGIAQGYQDVFVKITIDEVIYPTAKFSFGDRIQQYWFEEASSKIADTPEKRYEVHGNVETPFNHNCDFNYNFKSTFDNQNNFVIYDENGSTENVEFGIPVTILVQDKGGIKEKDVKVAKAYFDATKYHVLTENEAKGTAAAPKEIAVSADKKATTIVAVDGDEYLLFLNPYYPAMSSKEDSLNNIKTLYAVKKTNGKFIYDMGAQHEVVPAVKADDGSVITPALMADNVQAVVILTGDYNHIAQFQGKDDKTFDYARTLLNKAGHLQLLSNETFTTHMLLDVVDYCLPIQWLDETNRFDIRYLRPISGEAGNVHEIIDAVNNGSDVYLADIVNFQDWRAVEGKSQYHFSYNSVDPDGTKGWQYMRYYGVKRININYDDIESNISGPRKLLRLVTRDVQFEDNSKEWDLTEATVGKDMFGYFHYQNNQSNVDDFELYIPLSIEYYWGETAKQWITLKVHRTTGQARRK